MHQPGSSLLLNRLARDGYILLALAFLALRLFQVPPWDQSVDAYAYWTTRDGDLYDGQTAGAMGAYLYSPAFAQLDPAADDPALADLRHDLDGVQPRDRVVAAAAAGPCRRCCSSRSRSRSCRATST